MWVFGLLPSVVVCSVIVCARSPRLIRYEEVVKDEIRYEDVTKLGERDVI